MSHPPTFGARTGNGTWAEAARAKSCRNNSYGTSVVVVTLSFPIRVLQNGTAMVTADWTWKVSAGEHINVSGSCPAVKLVNGSGFQGCVINAFVYAVSFQWFNDTTNGTPVALMAFHRIVQKISQVYNSTSCSFGSCYVRNTITPSLSGRVSGFLNWSSSQTSFYALKSAHHYSVTIQIYCEVSAEVSSAPRHGYVGSTASARFDAATLGEHVSLDDLRIS